MGSGTSGKGSSSSRTSQQTSTTNVSSTVNTVDNRIVDGDNARIGGNVTVNPGENVGGINISTTDQGAIQAGLDIALESLGFAASSQAGIKSVASDSISQAYDLAQSARQSETSGAINNFLKYGVWIGLAAIAAYAFVQYRKR